MKSNLTRQRGHLSLAPRDPRRDISSLPPAVPALYAILSGRIPAREADRMKGGRGTGGPCAICDKPLAPFDIEFALEFRAGDGAGIYHVHVPCCMAWELELPR